MGIADRDYTKARSDRPWGGGLSMTWILIILNTAVHVVREVFGRSMQVADKFRTMGTGPNARPLVEDWLVNVGHFSTGRATFFFVKNVQTGQTAVAIPLEVWRFVTYQFLHADWFHLFFNMFGLFVFGPIVEEALGRRKFLAFVLVCGVFGAIAYVLLNLMGQGILLANNGQPLSVRIPGILFYDPLVPLVGASAGVFGVIMACAFVAPNTLIDIPLPPITVRMKPLAYTYLAIAAVQLFIGSKNAGGEAAHVGGALAGYFFVRRVHLLSDFFNLVGGPSEGAPRGGPYAPPRSARGPRGSAPLPARSARPATPAEAEVDRILQKVAEQGMASLSDGERRTLESESSRRRGED